MSKNSSIKDKELEKKAESDKRKKAAADAYMNQILVLRSLAPNEAPNAKALVSPKHMLLNEITLRSGLEEEKDVLRILYILEGQKLVSPFPSGDFTSKTWFLTQEGMRAIKLIAKSLAEKGSSSSSQQNQATTPR